MDEAPTKPESVPPSSALWALAALAARSISTLRVACARLGTRDAPVLPIPMKVVGDSDLIPVAGSEVKPGIFGAKRRWRSYRA